MRSFDMAFTCSYRIDTLTDNNVYCMHASEDLESIPQKSRHACLHVPQECLRDCQVEDCAPRESCSAIA